MNRWAIWRFASAVLQAEHVRDGAECTQSSFSRRRTSRPCGASPLQHCRQKTRSTKPVGLNHRFLDVARARCAGTWLRNMPSMKSRTQAFCLCPALFVCAKRSASMRDAWSRWLRGAGRGWRSRARTGSRRHSMGDVVSGGGETASFGADPYTNTRRCRVRNLCEVSRTFASHVTFCPPDPCIG